MGVKGFYLLCLCHNAYLYWIYSVCECIIPHFAQCLLVSIDIALNTQAMSMPWMFVVCTLG